MRLVGWLEEDLGAVDAVLLLYFCIVQRVINESCSRTV